MMVKLLLDVLNHTSLLMLGVREELRLQIQKIQGSYNSLECKENSQTVTILGFITSNRH